MDYFFKNFLLLKDFIRWRETNHHFVEGEQKIDKNKYFSLKREVIKIYGDKGRKIMEAMDRELGQTFQFKKGSLLLFGKLLKGTLEGYTHLNLTLIQRINVGFFCPDHEFKSLLCQLVYEELSKVFSFNEEFMKLHQFVRTASWTQPIALFALNSLNVINTVCSIASYYGVGLEVLRTESLPSATTQQYLAEVLHREPSVISDNEIIKNNLLTYNDKHTLLKSYERLLKEGSG
mmetsp:Transcript_23297/g.22890  ORF Transcript_23297/g.22890 Transcript_23297/m.22890 type:complete len:233 (+) Transcript_23297:3530-4228(+)